MQLKGLLYQISVCSAFLRTFLLLLDVWDIPILICEIIMAIESIDTIFYQLHNDILTDKILRYKIFTI